MMQLTSLPNFWKEGMNGRCRVLSMISRMVWTALIILSSSMVTENRALLSL